MADVRRPLQPAFHHMVISGRPYAVAAHQCDLVHRLEIPVVGRLGELYERPPPVTVAPCGIEQQLSVPVLVHRVVPRVGSLEDIRDELGIRPLRGAEHRNLGACLHIPPLRSGMVELQGLLLLPFAQQHIPPDHLGADILLHRCGFYPVSVFVRVLLEMVAVPVELSEFILGIRHPGLGQVVHDLRGLVDLVLVFNTNLIGRTVQCDLTVLDPDRPCTDVLHELDVVGNYQNGLPALGHLDEVLSRFRRESRIPHAQNLVHQYDIGLHIHHDGERQPPGHSGRISPDGIVYVLPYPGIIDDGLDLGVHLLLGEAVQLPFGVDVVPSAHVGMESHPQLQHRRQLPCALDGTGIRLHDPCQNRQEGALPGSVPPQDSKYFTLLDIQADIVQHGVHDPLGLHLSRDSLLVACGHGYLEGFADVPYLDGVGWIHFITSPRNRA